MLSFPNAKSRLGHPEFHLRAILSIEGCGGSSDVGSSHRSRIRERMRTIRRKNGQRPDNLNDQSLLDARQDKRSLTQENPR